MFVHNEGEVWHLHWSPHDTSLFSSIYSSVNDEGDVISKCAIWGIPNSGDNLEPKLSFEGLNNVKVWYFNYISNT